MRGFFTLLACLSLVCDASAMDGKLNNDANAKATGGTWNIGFGNANVETIVKTLNSWKVIPVTYDAALGSVVVATYKVEGKNFVVLCDELAKAINAKAVANGDGILITKGAGGNPAGGAGAAAPPAQTGGINWVTKNALACKAERKPVVLYYYDKLAKANEPLLNFFNSSLFMDPNVEKLLAGFTCVKLDTTNTLWPKDLAARGKNSGVVYLMTCEGNALAAFDKASGMPATKAFLDAANRTMVENTRVAEKYVKEDKAKLAQDEEKKDTVGGIPGLSGDKTVPAKTDAKKTDEKLEDENK